MPCATCHVFRYQIVEYIRTVFAISVPIVWDSGTSEQSRAIVFASFLLPWPIFALLRPYTYRGDMYFSHASYALTVAAPLMTWVGIQPNGAADGILTALLVVALILFVLPDQIIERFEARVCSRRSTSATLSQPTELPAPGGKKASSTSSEAKV